MGRMSREKGKAGEREFARLCKAYGYDAHRGQQYSGLGGEDIVGLPGVHVEVKRVESLRLYDALDQAKRDAGDKKPIVAHRRNRSQWVVIQPAEDWLEMYREWEAGRSEKPHDIDGITGRFGGTHKDSD